MRRLIKVETPGGEVQPQEALGFVVAQSGTERADPRHLRRTEPRGRRRPSSVVTISFSFMRMAKGMLFSLREEVDPRAPDELPVCQEQPNARGTEDRQIAPHQQGPLAGFAVAAVVVEHAPNQRHARPPGDDGQHQDVDVAGAELPLGAVEREMPRAVEPQQPDDKRRRPVGSKADVLEEPLQPAVGRGHERRGRTLAGDG